MAKKVMEKMKKKELITSLDTDKVYNQPFFKELLSSAMYDIGDLTKINDTDVLKKIIKFYNGQE